MSIYNVDHMIEYCISRTGGLGRHDKDDLVQVCWEAYLIAEKNCKPGLPLSMMYVTKCMTSKLIRYKQKENQHSKHVRLFEHIDNLPSEEDQAAPNTVLESISTLTPDQLRVLQYCNQGKSFEDTEYSSYTFYRLRNEVKSILLEAL